MPLQTREEEQEQLKMVMNQSLLEQPQNANAVPVNMPFQFISPPNFTFYPTQFPLVRQETLMYKEIPNNMQEVQIQLQSDQEDEPVQLQLDHGNTEAQPPTESYVASEISTPDYTCNDVNSGDNICDTA